MRDIRFELPIGTASGTGGPDGGSRPEPGTARGFVPPGGSISLGNDPTADNPLVATLEPPNTGRGAPITLRVETAGAGTFCGGQPCAGRRILFLSPFSGYADPNRPPELKIKWDTSIVGTSTTFAIYVQKQDGGPITTVPNCRNYGDIYRGPADHPRAAVQSAASRRLGGGDRRWRRRATARRGEPCASRCPAARRAARVPAAGARVAAAASRGRRRLGREGRRARSLSGPLSPRRDDELVSVRRPRRPRRRLRLQPAADLGVPREGVAGASRPLRPRRRDATAASGGARGAARRGVGRGPGTGDRRPRAAARRRRPPPHRGGLRAARSRRRAGAPLGPRPGARGSRRAYRRGARRGGRRVCRSTSQRRSRTVRPSESGAARERSTAQARRGDRIRRSCGRSTILRPFSGFAATSTRSCSRGPRSRSSAPARARPTAAPWRDSLGRELAGAGLVVVSGHGPGYRRRGTPGRARRGRGHRRRARLRHRPRLPAAHRDLAGRIVERRADRLGVRAGHRAGALAVPGAKQDHRRSLLRNRRRRGARALGGADHGGLRARGRAGGDGRSGRDHLRRLGRVERPAPARRDAGHRGCGRARGVRDRAGGRAGRGPGGPRRGRARPAGEAAASIDELARAVGRRARRGRCGADRARARGPRQRG